MSMITRSEVKRFVNQTASDYDVLIDALIPEVEEDICLHCNTYFGDTVVYRESGSAFEFHRDTSTGDYITDANSDLSTAGFLEGDDIVILGGGSNEGLHAISTSTGSVAAGQIVLAEKGQVREIDQDDAFRWPGVIRIARVNWPTGIKPIAARAIWYLAKQTAQFDEKSERIDDYSVTYMGQNEYPERVVRGLEKYRKPRFR